MTALYTIRQKQIFQTVVHLVFYILNEVLEKSFCVNWVI